MNAPFQPRCELPDHVLFTARFAEAQASVSVHERKNTAEIYFYPVVTYRDRDGHLWTRVQMGECCDLPDFSTDETGERQCFHWGYANIEDALRVVRTFNWAVEAHNHDDR